MQWEGYAVMHKGELLVDTVSSTERAAKVNFLVTTCQIMVLGTWTDEVIEKAWRQYSKDTDAEVTKIIMYPKKEIDWSSYVNAALELIKQLPTDHNHGTIDCPMCQGKINWQRQTNGHRWLKCETENCLLFME